MRFRSVVLCAGLLLAQMVGARDVLLLGDSIRLGYGPYVKEILEARGDRVYQPSDNCRFALYTLRNLQDWAGQVPDREKVEVVHWNNGLWDVGELLPGEPTTPVEFYTNCLVRTVRHLKHYFPNAKIVFATTTPLNEKASSPYHTLGQSVVDQYNAAARAALAGKVDAINDLNAYVKANGLSVHYADIVHYKTEGYKLLAREVVRVIDATK